MIKHGRIITLKETKHISTRPWQETDETPKKELEIMIVRLFKGTETQTGIKWWHQ